MHVSFRKIIGEDPFSRNIYLNHSLSQDSEEYFYYLMTTYGWDPNIIYEKLLNEKDYDEKIY